MEADPDVPKLGVQTSVSLVTLSPEELIRSQFSGRALGAGATEDWEMRKSIWILSRIVARTRALMARDGLPRQREAHHQVRRSERNQDHGMVRRMLSLARLIWTIAQVLQSLMGCSAR